jgi:hypothetical protein
MITKRNINPNSKYFVGLTFINQLIKNDFFELVLYLSLETFRIFGSKIPT